MNVVFGVDPRSASLALVVTVDDLDPLLLKRPLPSANKDIGKLCSTAEQWVYRKVREYSGARVHVYIENPFISPKTIRAVLPLARLNGALHAGAHRGKARTVEGVDIQRWKSQIVGNGAASKPQVKQWCRECWPEVYDQADGDQDLLDAAAINRYGSKMIQLQRRLRKGL